MKTTKLGALAALTTSLLALGGCEEEAQLVATRRVCQLADDVDFGAIALRTVESRRVTFENCGNIALEEITARIEIEGEDPEIFYVPPAAVAVPVFPEQTFSLPVAFRPEQVGAAEAVLLIEDPTDAEREIGRLKLTGVGFEPDRCLLADPAELVFEPTLVGESREATVTFTNLGSDDCRPSGLGVRAGAAHFAIDGEIPASLPAGAAFEVQVRFAPQAEGALEGSAGVVLDGREEVAVALRGEGVVERRCALVGPSPAIFPRAAAAFSSSELRFEVRNAGLADCVVSAAQSGSAEFALVAGLDADAVIAPGEAAVVDMRFTPSAAGARSGQLLVDTADGALHAVDLSGFADPEPGCVFDFDPPVAAFPDTAVGLSHELTVEVVNAGQIACTLTGLAVEGDAFSVSRAPANGAYAPGEGFEVDLRFAPEQRATSLGALRFLVDESGAPELALFGRAGQGALVFTPSITYFGSVTEGCASDTAALFLANAGDAPARIDALAFSAASDPNFEILTDLTGVELRPGEGRQIQVRMLGDPSLATHVAELRAFASGTEAPYAATDLFGESLSSALAARDEDFLQSQVPQVDILFVIDDSGSMEQEQANLALNFDSFISFTNQLEIDYHLAITTTSASIPSRGGHFAGPFIANRGLNPTPDPVLSFNTQARVGTGGSGVEEGLRAAHMALTPPLSDGVNAGFLREPALLSLVFVSDEDDFSTGAVGDWVERFLALKDFRTDRVVASAIAGDVPFGCATAEAGSRYEAVARVFGGVFASVCDDNFAVAMEAIGLNVFDALRGFDLETTPDPATIVVTITPAAGGPTVVVPEDPLNGWSLTDERRVVLNGTSVPQPGDLVNITYTALCLAP